MPTASSPLSNGQPSFVLDNGSFGTGSSPPSRIVAHGTPGPSALKSRGRGPTVPSPLSPNHHEHHIPPPLHPPSGAKRVHIAPETDEAATPPCFIHSGLDKHGSLQNWLRNKHEQENRHQKETREPIGIPHQPVQARTPRRGGPKPFTPVNPELARPNEVISTPGPPEPSDDMGPKLDGSAIYETESMDEDYDDDDDDDLSESISRQLAATAQGVREVSKELSRTRVHSRVQAVLIVTKARDNRLIKLTREIALYLMLRKPPATASAASSTTDVRSIRNSSPDRGMIVYVDNQLRHSQRFDAEGLQRDYPHLFEPIQRRRSSSSNSASTTSVNSLASSWTSSGNGQSSRKDDGQLRFWTSDMCSNSPQLFDFVVTLGGDGTVLFTSWLFQKIVPPVLPFALGSLGFLTNFDFKSYQETMDRCIDEGIRVNLRMRFTCTVYRAVAPDAEVVVGKPGKRKAIRRPGGEILIRQVDKDGWEALEGGAPIGGKGDTTKEREIKCFTTKAVEQFEVLNDLVVDRGPSPYVSLLEVFGDDHHLTTVQADGLTVSTPTGSTAYSLSAGGSLVHPGIPAMLMTPICPHTLSFRPMLLPDGMELRVCVPYNSRSTAWASFDGRGRVELKQGDHIKITASKYPFPTVCAEKQSTDWFRSIQRTLKWNERERQRSFVVVEEDFDDDHKKTKKSSTTDGRQSFSASEGDEYYSEEEEFEEEFDIDDKSTGEQTPPQSETPHINPPNPVAARMKARHHLADDYRSGVQSPDRFVAGYRAPPPLSQRHLLEALANVENKLRRVELSRQSHTASSASASPEPDESHDEHHDEHHDTVAPLPPPAEEDLQRSESDATVAPDNAPLRPSSRRDSENTLGGRTPRQGRSRSRSRVRGSGGSRSESPAIGSTKKPKAFAFFGHDDSQSEFSD